jgi:type I restriction enzyme S subunit
MRGIKVLSISRTSLTKTTVLFPASNQEQSQTGATFTDIDRLITLRQSEPRFDT